MHAGVGVAPSRITLSALQHAQQDLEVGAVDQSSGACCRPGDRPARDRGPASSVRLWSPRSCDLRSCPFSTAVRATLRRIQREHERMRGFALELNHWLAARDHLDAFRPQRRQELVRPFEHAPRLHRREPKAFPISGSKAPRWTSMVISPFSRDRAPGLFSSARSSPSGAHFLDCIGHGVLLIRRQRRSGRKKPGAFAA